MDEPEEVPVDEPELEERGHEKPAGFHVEDGVCCQGEMVLSYINIFSVSYYVCVLSVDAS